MTEAEDGSESEMQGGIDDSEQENLENSDEEASGNPPSNDDTQDDGETDYTDDPAQESLNEHEEQPEPTSTSQDDDRLDNDEDQESEGTGGTREEQEFLEELMNFFKERKMEFKPPKFYGKDLNWLKLWKVVTGLGGYEQVTIKKLWRRVGDLFDPPPTCTTLSWSFRGFYEKSLLGYEKVKFGTSGGAVKQQARVAVDQGALSPTTPSSQPSAGAAQGRARRDAASRAMQGWHSQRTNGNGEAGERSSKDKGSGATPGKRDKPLKKGTLKRKGISSLDHDAKSSQQGKGVRSHFVEDSGAVNNTADDDDKYGSASPITKRNSKEQRPAKISKSEVFVTINPKITDDGPPADWVKINVHRTPDSFEVYALVPGLVREEVRIQCEAGGRLVIAGEPEHPDNPWGVTAFRKVISLPSRIDAHSTSAVVTLHGQLCVRVPFAPPES